MINEEQPSLSPPELLEEIVRCLVKHPEDVDVQEAAGISDTILDVRVADEDVGQVIGKGGSTIKLIEALFARISARGGKRIIISVTNPKNRKDHAKV